MSKERVKLVATDITEHRCKRSSSTHHRGWQEYQGPCCIRHRALPHCRPVKADTRLQSRKEQFPKRKKQYEKHILFLGNLVGWTGLRERDRSYGDTERAPRVL